MDCKTCVSLVATWVCLATSLPEARCLRQQTRGARDGGLGPDGVQAPVRYERGLMIGLGIGMWARLHACTQAHALHRLVFSLLCPMLTSEVAGAAHQYVDTWTSSAG